MHPSVTTYLPFLAWPRLSPALLRNELAAGLTLGLMLLPQGVAYAALAGMPLITGIYACLLPALIAVLWGGTPRLGVGPTALTSLLIGSSLAGLSQPGSAHWVSLAAWLAICSGALQWLLGALRSGWLLNLVTSPVLNGFTQAAGALILLSQLPSLLGLRTSWSALWHTPSLHHFDPRSAGFGLLALVLLVVLKKKAPRLPAAVLVIALCGLVSWWFGFAQEQGAVVGHLPSGLPSLSLPAMLSLPEATQLIMPVLVIALVSFLEVASSAQIEHRAAGTRWNENQDLLAQGMAKISAGLCGSFPVSASFSRSAVNMQAGAKTGWATVCAIGLMLIAVLWLTPVLYHIPQAALAAVVVASVISLIKPRALWALLRISRTEGAIALITCGLTLGTAPNLYWGVLAGILMSLCHFLYHRLHPRIIEIGLHPDGSLRSRHIWSLPPLAPEVLALRMDADLDFASASALERTIHDRLQARPELRHVYLAAQPINRIDITGVEVFIRLRQALFKHGGTLHIGGMKLPVEQILQQAGALAPGADLALHRTDAQALAHLDVCRSERQV